MACINPDGTLSPTAKKFLRSVEEPLTLLEISQRIMVPVFMLRVSVRELLGAGYVKEVGEAYQVTEKGRVKAG